MGAQTHPLAQASFKRAKLGGEERAATLCAMITNVASPGCLLSSAPMTYSLLMESFNLPFTAFYPLASVSFLAFLTIGPHTLFSSSPRTYTWTSPRPHPSGAACHWKPPWSQQQASPMAQWQRIHLQMQETQETQVWSLGQEDPLGEEMSTHSSILAWKIPWTEEPGRLQSTGLQRVRHDWLTKHTHAQCVNMLIFSQLTFSIYFRYSFGFFC